MAKIVKVDFRRNDAASKWQRQHRTMRIRAEKPTDRGAVRAVNEAAFKSSSEANIVHALRVKIPSVISLVAERDRAIVGHIMFSPVSLAQRAVLKIMGLGPMAVAPEHQGMGIGSALVRAGLARCEELGCDAVVVVGHADYYPRFGFVSAAQYGISCEYNVPDDAFMVLELHPSALHGISGMIQYDEVFGGA